MEVINYNYTKIIILDSLIGNDYTINLCKALGQQKSNITLILPVNRQGIEIEGVKVQLWAPSKDKTVNKLKKIFDYIFYWLKIFSLVSFDKNVIIHFQFFRRNFDLFFMLILRLIGVKIVYTAHNIFPHERTKLDFLRSKIIFKTSHKIIIHSNFIKNKILQNFPFCLNKISIIPHGNFDNYLSKRSMTKTTARNVLNLPQVGKVILFFGYIREYKGLDLLIDAFELALKQNNSLYLVIAGQPFSDDLKLKYEQRIEHSFSLKQIHYNFNFIPSEDLATYFLSSDIVVLPYKSIDHSGLIHLAYSFGKPVLASDVGDFAEIIEENKSGKIFKEYNPENLASILLSLISDYDLEKMGIYAKYVSDSKYSWENIAEETCKVYKSFFN